MPQIALMGGTVIDGTGADPYSANVLVSGRRIAAVGSELQPERDAQTVDVAGLTVLPGLIDAHIHMAMTGGVETSPAVEQTETYAVLRSAQDMVRTLKAGFTTVRDLAGKNYMEFALREAIEGGVLPGPRLRLAGKIISMTTAGSHFYPGMYEIADGADAVRVAARTLLAQGADVVKVMATAGAYCPGEDPRWTSYGREEMAPAIEEAHKLGRTVAAHAEGIEGIRNAVMAGCDTIEHGDFLYEDEEVLSSMRDRGTILVPTMISFQAVVDHPEAVGIPGFIRDNCNWIAPINRRSVRAAHELGVGIALGTDAGTPFNRHGDNAQELLLLVQAGLSNHEVLQSATSIAARAVGMGAETGVVEAGRLADLLVIEGDPIEDIRILTDSRRIRLLFKDGRQVVGIGEGDK